MTTKRHVACNIFPLLKPTNIIPLDRGKGRRSPTRSSATSSQPTTWPPSKPYHDHKTSRHMQNSPFAVFPIAIMLLSLRTLPHRRHSLTSHHATSYHTHTHLLRNILSNYCCGVHRACTNNPLESDRRKWMTGQENLSRRNLSLSLQKATVPSDEIGSKSDCENRTVD